VNHPYKKGIKSYNSGDSVFWEKNYYNAVGDDPKRVEKFLGQSVENDYNQLITTISQEKSILSLSIKLKIFEWIFYSKLRSPNWRNHLSQLVDKKSNNKSNNSEIRELHMAFFNDSDLFKYFNDTYAKDLTIKKWRILICPKDRGWITTDSPGIMINLKEFAKSPEDYCPNVLWNNMQNDSAFYFPLTSKYCLELWPYDEQDDVKRNLGTDPVAYIKPSEDMYNQINFWTMHSASEILISQNESDLHYYKKILNQ
jgi:hypothetical protein